VGASVQLTTIFFDAGGTIVFPDPALTLAALAKLHLFPIEQQLQAAERDAKRQFDAGRARHASVDGRYWELYYLSLFRELGIADNVELRATLVAAARSGKNWRRMRSQTREVLERLKGRYRIGLISNSDVHRLFELLKLDDCFASFTDSRHCGFEKPDRRIFECALAELGATPEESLYVGDIYSIDFIGAQSAGMSAVLFDIAGAYRDTAYPRVESLAELEARLDQSRPQAV
jgi:HAD superfamily hydrolase (TIGR01509 family)